MAPQSQNGSQRSERSTGAMFGFSPFRFPRESGGPGTAVAPLLRSGPQRSGYSAGAGFGFF